MGIKSNVRSVLPATTRNVETRFSELEQRLGEVISGQDVLRGELFQQVERSVADVGQSASQGIQKLDDRLSAFETERHKPSSCNLEYLSLNREYQGKRVLLAGWYGASNCGDELMMRSILQHFEGTGTRVSVLLWDDPDYDFSTLPPLADQIHYPNSLWELRQLSEYFDALVWGGGAIIDEKQFSHDPKNCNTGNLFIWLSEEMLKRNRSVYAIGLSANATLEADTEFTHRLSNVIKGSAHVSLRDAYSLGALEDAGVDCSGVQICEDVVFGNDGIGKRPPSGCGEASYTLGMVLMLGDMTYDHNKRVVPRVLNLLGNRFGENFKLKLIPFYNFWKFDTVLLSQLCDELGVSEKVEIVPYADRLESIPFGECDSVIAYRYHACLVSASFGIPTLFMCVDMHPHYRNKMRHIAGLFGREDCLLMASTCLDDGSFDDRLSSLFDNGVMPCVPDGLFEDTSRFLDGVCRSIVED